MKIEKRRASLAGIWALGFSFSLIAALYLKLIVGIGPHSASDLLDAIIGQYVPYLGTVVAFSFSSRAHQESVRHGKLAFILAVLFSGLWNTITLSLILQACISPDLTEETIANLHSFLAKLAWLVAPALGYFFSNSKEATSEIAD